MVSSERTVRNVVLIRSPVGGEIGRKPQLCLQLKVMPSKVEEARYRGTGGGDAGSGRFLDRSKKPRMLTGTALDGEKVGRDKEEELIGRLVS